jgi:hypothetical protein
VIRIRALTLVLAALGAGLLAGSARADEAVRARVRVAGDQVRLEVSGRDGVAVVGSLARPLAALDGREVVVALDGGRVTRVLAPERTVLRGARAGADFVGAAGARRGLTGPAADLVPRGRPAAVDAWDLGDEAVVLAVEGRTTGAWTVLHLLSGWTSPADVIRGERAVWVLARRDGRLLVQRGASRGWVAATAVTLGEDPTPGITGGLPR